MRIDRASHASSPRVSTPGGGRDDGESLLAPGSTPVPDLPVPRAQEQWPCMGTNSPVTVAGPRPESHRASSTAVACGADIRPRTAPRRHDRVTGATRRAAAAAVRRGRRPRAAASSASVSAWSATRSPEPVQPRLAHGGEVGVRGGDEAPSGCAARPRRGTRGGTRRSPARRASVVPHTEPAPARRQERLGAVVDGDHAVVDLVAVAPAARAPCPTGRPSVFSRANRTSVGQQPEPRHRAGPRLDVVGDRAGRASGSRRRCRAPGRPRRPRRAHGVGEPGLPQPARSATVARVPGSDDEVGVGQLLGPGREPDEDAGLGGQRVEVGEVGQPRQPHHRDPQDVLAARGRCLPAPPRRGRASPRRRATGRPATAARRASGRPVSRVSSSSPGSSSRTSPRNLLTRKPATSAWSAGGSSATVP